MDGTIYLSDTLFPYTLPFLEDLEAAGIGYSFLTNNPSRCRKAYLDKLSGMGIRAGLDNMYTTIEATIDYIKVNLPGVRRLFILGTPSMVSEFEAAGFQSVYDDPEAVVAAFDRTLVYDRLCKAAWWVKKGLPYVATNPDRVCPTDQDTVLVDCGSICAALEYATGRRPDAVLGKPDPQILYTIARDKGILPSEIAMVGDRMYTDVASGLNAGALSVLVLSGETTLSNLSSLASEIRPDLVCRDLAEFGSLLKMARL
ncbi:MAG: HAD-IIA family hydrolase [Bacteroidales bacterium]|nr:HAD-IIA family hydrolase [Bacteroidales bacterium]